MKKKLQLIGAVMVCSITFGQEVHTKRCATVDYMNYRESKQAGYIQSTKNVFNSAISDGSLKSGETYTIPVVVHVLYNTPAQNLHDSVIFNQIRVLNEDFNRLNADTANLRPAFFPHAGKGNVQFKLAEFDPSGSPTNGITRTSTTNSTFAGSFFELYAGDMSSIERVKSTADGGINPWNQSRYLNIWICNMAIDFLGTEMPLLMGYATPPEGLSNWPAGSVDGLGDGVVLQYQVVGSNNPNDLDIDGTTYVVKGRTGTHEVGHYLGLRHIWGDGDCSQEDGIADTPNANSESSQDCNKTKNTCTDNIGGIDLPDMVENFMDYSAEDCQNSFTEGQMNLIRAVLENNRYDLIHNNAALSISSVEIFEVSLFPNPANETVTLKSKEFLNGKIIISDLNGKVVKEVSANGLETVISIDNLQDGAYQVSVEGPNSTRAFAKLIKL